ncbi:MAG TPA: LecA/PA-IL family lectin [Pyrinomonadaceae bacterium]|nr:LecA/PA-IL family lectin [Pyrinomonadaceae bacterium]
MKKSFTTALLAILLILTTSLSALADTIRLKDGSVIRGQIIGFRDQQFIVLVGQGARGRRSEVRLYMEDVESIEFDNATAGNTGGTFDGGGSTTQPTSSRPASTPSRPGNTGSTSGNTGAGTSTTRPASTPPTFQVNTRVRGDATTNGWTNTGLVVRRGQRIRITATGNVNLGAGRVATPAGIRTLPDGEKLMRNEPTGALIAVIGDDNDDFILVGRTREFTAQRDGVLFLGINEGNLNDNTGGFDAIIEAEAIR